MQTNITLLNSIFTFIILKAMNKFGITKHLIEHTAQRCSLRKPKTKKNLYPALLKFNVAYFIHQVALYLRLEMGKNTHLKPDQFTKGFSNNPDRQGKK
jgi:hypothetical protein